MSKLYWLCFGLMAGFIIGVYKTQIFGLIGKLFKKNTTGTTT